MYRIIRSAILSMLKNASAAVVLLALGHATSSFAQSYPRRPVRLIIPPAAGGSADIVGRPLAQKLGETFGQQFVVDNCLGAACIIGAEIAER